MLDRARSLGGSHFVIVDADEVPTANLLPRLRELALRPAAGAIVSMPMISPYHRSDVYRWDGSWGAKNRIPWAFCDSPALHWKIADGYHSIDAPQALDAGTLFHRRSRCSCFICSSPVLRGCDARQSGTRWLRPELPRQANPEQLNHLTAGRCAGAIA
jgi:hypothetical protein